MKERKYGPFYETPCMTNKQLNRQTDGRAKAHCSL